MTITEGLFYRFKGEVEGKKAPEAFAYVVKVDSKNVKFAVTDSPNIKELTGGAFTISVKDFEKIIDKAFTS